LAEIICTYRDHNLKKAFFEENKNLHGCKLNFFDNNQTNLGIPKRYNQFLDQYDFSRKSWFIFCHEDFLINDRFFQEKLEKLDQNFIYGPIGANFTKKNFKIPFSDKFSNLKLVELKINTKLLGNLIQRNKAGKNKKKLGQAQIVEQSSVDTLDCCCMIIHSGLINLHKLRFDENLNFDLYIEDFCINSKEKYQIYTKVFNFECEHWSEGKITQRYFKQLELLDKKYPKCLYAGTCSSLGAGSSKIFTKNREFFEFLTFIRKFLGLTSILNFFRKKLY